MTETSAPTRASWLPLIIVMLCQIQLSFNAFNVSIAGITTDLGIPATSVGTALTTGTFAMAGFILLGAKVGARIGVRRAFQIGVLVPAAAAFVITFAQNGTELFIAQAISGASVALSAPALTVLIARNYRGRQQAQAIGFLASAIPLAQVISLLIAGYFASTIGWRWSFALVGCIGLLNFALSWLLKPITADGNVAIDWTGAVLSSAAIISISFGFTGLVSWGFWHATAQAPFSIAGLSPVPFFLIVGLVLLILFFIHQGKKTAAGTVPLLNLKVVKGVKAHATLIVMSAMLFVGTATSFLMPLYMQMVRGLGGLETSLSVVPYTISIFIANTLVVRLYDRFSPAQIARTGLWVVTIALGWLGVTILTGLGQWAVILGLITLGLAQGCIVALVFNTLLTLSPADAAGDVGAVRGVTHNVSGSAGIAVASAIAVAILGGTVASSAQSSEHISTQLVHRLDFGNVNFITDDHVVDILHKAGATESEVTAGGQYFANARLSALSITMFILAALALAASFAAPGMPRKTRSEGSSDAPAPEAPEES